MILSYDTIKNMKPPYQLTEEVLKIATRIAEKLGEIDARNLHRPRPELRKANRIKTIQSSLEIEGNTLTEQQITALLGSKTVIGPQKDILEVQNAIDVYNNLHSFNPNNLKDFEKAHGILMKGLIDKPGKLRTKNVGIAKESKVAHVAPGGDVVKTLMKNLFDYLENDTDILLIKSCVFHYELEFIHPFIDGNGRMGRLWQTVILMRRYPVFEYLPIEHLIKQNQKAYYDALSKSDRLGHATPFILFMLEMIYQALNDLLKERSVKLTQKDRIAIFKEKIGDNEFSRKDYLRHFHNISQATASRDLKWAVENNILYKQGDKRLTVYRYK